MIRVVSTGDLGLDVLTGGGWRLVKRFEERESACVVVRGGPGAGKSTLGIHVALELAKELGGDVAVGCVEILPTEYVAQLQSTRPSLEPERVVQLPAHPAPLAEGTGPRVFIGLMTELDPAQPDLAANLAALGAAVESAGGRPTVFIVDSLIEGYGIGSSISRIDADATIKFAVQGGYALVLCEETASDEPSPWVFAADTVLQLGVESRERGRWVEVKKHRFGPSATGRHGLELVGESGVPAAFPSSDAWCGLGRSALGTTTGPPPGGGPGLTWPVSQGAPALEFSARSVLITSRGAGTARARGLSLLTTQHKWAARIVVRVDATIANVEEVPASDGEPRFVWLPRHRGPERFARSVIEAIEATGANHGCLILDEFPAVASGPDGEAWYAALVTICTVTYDARPAWTIVICDADPSSAPWRSRLSTVVEACVIDDGVGGEDVVTIVLRAQPGLTSRWPKIAPAYEPPARARQRPNP